MQLYRVLQKIHADTPEGVPAEFTSGRIVTAEDIHPGTLESMVALRQAEPFDPDAPPAADAGEPANALHELADGDAPAVAPPADGDAPKKGKKK